MSPLITAQKLDRELKARHSTTNDPLFKALIEDRIKANAKLMNREISLIHQRQDIASREAEITERARIKCGLRNLGAGMSADKPSHWYWDTASEQDTKELERIRVKLENKLFWQVDKALVRKFHILGGVSKTLKSLGLELLLALPEATRKDKALVTLKLVEMKLNGEVAHT